MLCQWAALNVAAPLLVCPPPLCNRRGCPVPNPQTLDTATDLAAPFFGRALDDYDNFVGEFAALKAHVLSLPAAFQASVRLYFLSDVHFVAIAASRAEQLLAMPWAASVLMNYPLATVQIIVPSRLSFGLDNAPALELLRHRGLANSVTEPLTSLKPLGYAPSNPLLP